MAGARGARIRRMNSYGLIFFAVLVLLLVGFTFLKAGGEGVAIAFGESGQLAALLGRE